jgi:hypothetical protein
MLAEQSVLFFNDIIPLLYQYLPNATVGNLDILKLTVMLLLPDSVSTSFHFIYFYILTSFFIDG